MDTDEFHYRLGLAIGIPLIIWMFYAHRRYEYIFQGGEIKPSLLRQKGGIMKKLLDRICDWLVLKTGHAAVIGGFVGIVYITKYDTLLYRSNSYGVNAMIGFGVCIAIIGMGFLHMAYWQEKKKKK